MRTLLVQPRTPKTYWAFQDSLPITGYAASLPPLGLVTLGALLPREWELRLVDLNVRPLEDDELRWADVVMVTGMLVHADSAREVLARARALGRTCVVGGPAASSAPDDFPDADIVFCGEAEGRIQELVAALDAGQPSTRRVLAPAGAAPEMSAVPVPRFDLLDWRPYASMSIQYSRGCPFLCEFCDVVELFGRRPRVKSPGQILAELDALLGSGYRGSLFFVDDNFIGNRNATAELLPEIERWQRARGFPFDFYTEASVDLAGEPELVRAMVRAGFSAAFLGIETPSGAALAEAGKLQNLKRPPKEAVEALTRAGIEVYAGFIVGFDSDREDIFRAQREFIASVPIPLAMVGMLVALPGTQLGRRLAREGRLRSASNGDQFGRPNFVPAMDEGALVAGYRELLASVYEPKAYYDRCMRLMDMLGRDNAPLSPRPDGIAIVLRSMLRIGLLSPRRRFYWRLLWRALRHSPRAFARAISLAIQGEHLIRYTREHVLPRLDDARAEVRASPQVPLVQVAVARVVEALPSLEVRPPAPSPGL